VRGRAEWVSVQSYLTPLASNAYSNDKFNYSKSLKMPIPEGDPRIRILKMAFVIYYHVDLAKVRQFYLDFGMSIAAETPGKEIFFAGYGSEPFIYVARQAEIGSSDFGGAAFEVESRAELERASSIKGATSISNIAGPGGGEIITLTDPAGHKVHLVCGQTPKARRRIKLQKLGANTEHNKPQKSKPKRFKLSPAPVHRWGHYGVSYPEGYYQKMYDWYTANLALAPSDLVSKDGKPTSCFMHIDRGLEFTDHHAFFFRKVKPGEKPSIAHTAFQVHDLDIQQRGHDYLAEKGYELCWGVGQVSD
jgi:hypothetical protein